MTIQQIIHDLRMLRNTTTEWSRPALTEAIEIIKMVDEMKKANEGLMREIERTKEVK